MSDERTALAYHVAIVDDWEAGLGLGSYEAATRGVLYEPGGHIRAVTADLVQSVLDERYRDLTLPLLLVALDPDALVAAGVPVEQDSAAGRLRILGPIPAGDDTVVRGVVPLRRDGDRWLAPGLGAS